MKTTFKICLLTIFCMLFVGRISAFSGLEQKNDTLISFSLYKNDTSQLNVIKSIDDAAQYPFIAVENHSWVKGDTLSVVVNKAKNGFLYLLTIDSMQRFRTLKEYHFDDIVTHTIRLNDDPMAPFPSSGYLFLIYSNTPIEHYNKVLLGMEFTYGSLLSRITRQLGDAVYLPCADWSLNVSKQASVNLFKVPGEVNSKAFGNVIPILIQFNQLSISNFSDKQTNKLSKTKKN